MHHVRTKYHTFNEFAEAECGRGIAAQAARQLMTMYRTARVMEAPVILELGTQRGASTTVLLQACEEADGRLVSVDVEDCSDVTDSPRWQFVREDSTDVAAITSQAPYLSEGIDILYIDSLHQKEHVERELTGWYGLMKPGSHIFLDDVDANPYRAGHRKDNMGAEIAYDEIREYVEAFFHANQDDLFMDITYGSTGLAHIWKRSPLAASARPPLVIVRRTSSLTTAVMHYTRHLGRLARRRIFARAGMSIGSDMQELSRNDGSNSP